MYPYLVADIGGTNARFALVTGKHQQQYQIEQVRVLNAADHPSFASALRAYLTGLDIKPQAACVAIAGPITGDQVRMTNLNWSFSCQAMAQEFGLEKFLALNDFAAVAAACSQLTAEHLITIKSGEEVPDANKAVFGAGTGLGVAGLANFRGQWIPIPSEGGHVNIAPTNALEADVIKAAMGEHGHVSAEMFLSGPGLVNLYRALGLVRGEQIEALKPSDLTQRAVDNQDALCKETLTLFCALAGAFAGNLALTYGAPGGVYIAGGVMPRFADFLRESPFAERFAQKGVMSHYVQPIPAHLIVHPETAFVGAAAWLEQQLSL